MRLYAMRPTLILCAALILSGCKDKKIEPLKPESWNSWTMANLQGKVKSIEEFWFTTEKEYDSLTSKMPGYYPLLQIKYVYDKNGCEVEYHELNAKGKTKGKSYSTYEVKNGLVLTRVAGDPPDCMITMYKYKENRLDSIQQHLCTEGENNTNSLAFATQAFHYNSKGLVNLVVKESIYLDSIYYFYDKTGARTREMQYGQDDYLKRTLDQHGNVTEEVLYNNSGSVLDRVSNSYSYDNKGNWTEMERYHHSDSTYRLVQRKLKYY